MGSPEPSPKRPGRTAARHLLLGFFVLLALFFTAALCSLPR
ncbi:MAG: hypothetical protein AABY63_07675 [candidate division NC10 bacterium]